VTEIPYQVNSALIEKIAELVREKVVEASPICGTSRTATACGS
jgi:DNA gyrase/topoisomerase IV subunit A